MNRLNTENMVEALDGLAEVEIARRQQVVYWQNGKGAVFGTFLSPPLPRRTPCRTPCTVECSCDLRAAATDAAAGRDVVLRALRAGADQPVHGTVRPAPPRGCYRARCTHQLAHRWARRFSAHSAECDDYGSGASGGGDSIISALAGGGMQPLPSQSSQPSAAATESLIGALGMSIAASGAGGEDGGGAAMSRARFAAALLRAAQDPVVIDQAFAQYQEFVKGQEAEVEVEDEAAVIEQESFAAEEGPETMEVLGLEAEGGAAVGGAPQGEPQAAWPPGAPAQHAAASSAMSPFDALASGRETPATSGCVCAQPNQRLERQTFGWGRTVPHRPTARAAPRSAPVRRVRPRPRRHRHRRTHWSSCELFRPVCRLHSVSAAAAAAVGNSLRTRQT